MNHSQIAAPLGGRSPNLQKLKWGIFSYITIIAGGLASIELGRGFDDYDRMGIITLNAYAFSIGVCGLGVLFAGLAIRGLLNRIETLEARLGELSDGNHV